MSETGKIYRLVATHKGNVRQRWFLAPNDEQAQVDGAIRVIQLANRFRGSVWENGYIQLVDKDRIVNTMQKGK